MVLPSSLNVPVNRCEINLNSVRQLQEWLIGSVGSDLRVIPRG
jgi:hypothetical protein